jgi:hypothetical protein
LISQIMPFIEYTMIGLDINYSANNFYDTISYSFASCLPGTKLVNRRYLDGCNVFQVHSVV